MDVEPRRDIADGIGEVEALEEFYPDLGACPECDVGSLEPYAWLMSGTLLAVCPACGYSRYVDAE